MLNLEEALEQFNDLAPEVVLTIDSVSVSEKISALEDKYKISLSSLIIYWSIGEVKVDDFKDYLVSELDLELKLATQIQTDIIETIIKPINDRLIFLDASPSKAGLSMAQEKIIILDILKNKLLIELNNHPIIINAINARIFATLSIDHDFFDTMEKALYDNQEKITSDFIVINGKKVVPSVSNWLNDFLSQYGTENFSTINLSQYATDSVNMKNLSPIEKENVTKLLILYRNLKFFPETFDEISTDKWEILPIRLPNEIENINTNKEVLAPVNEPLLEMTALEIKALQESQRK